MIKILRRLFVKGTFGEAKKIDGHWSNHNYQISGNCYNNRQKIKGSCINSRQKIDGDCINEGQVIEGNCDNSHQEVKGEIYVDNISNNDLEVDEFIRKLSESSLRKDRRLTWKRVVRLAMRGKERLKRGETSEEDEEIMCAGCAREFNSLQRHYQLYIPEHDCWLRFCSESCFVFYVENIREFYQCFLCGKKVRRAEHKKIFKKRIDFALREEILLESKMGLTGRKGEPEQFDENGTVVLCQKCFNEAVEQLESRN